MHQYNISKVLLKEKVNCLNEHEYSNKTLKGFRLHLGLGLGSPCISIDLVANSNFNHVQRTVVDLALVIIILNSSYI